MKVSYTKTSNTEQEIQAEISAADFDKYLDKASATLSEGLDIQGFRKGHAPKSIVEQRVGSSRLYTEAADIAVRDTYNEALNGLSGAEREALGVGDKRAETGTMQLLPEIQVTKLAPGNPFIYKAIFTVPVFEITEDYSNIARKIKEREKKEVVVEEKDVENTLNWLVKNHKTAKDKGRDELDEVSNPGKNPVEIDSSQAKIDSSRIKLDSSQAKIDDNFAKSIGSFKNLEELKKSIHKGIYLEKEKKEKDRLRIAMIKGIIEQSKREIPDKVVSSEISKMEEEFREDVAQMGLDFDEYLGKIKKKKEDLHNGWREQARDRVEIYLALDALGQKEKINPNDEEVEAEAQKLLTRHASSKESDKKFDPVRGRSPQGGRSRASGRAASNEVDPVRLRAYVSELLKRDKTFEFLEQL